MHNLQQIDIDLLKQSTKNLSIIIEVLNYNGTIIDELQGELVDGSLSIDANSDIRRTCELTVYVKNNKYFIDSKMLIWLNKFIRIKIGVTSSRTKETVWYKCGTYLFTKASYQYDSENNLLSLSCSDLMSLLTGLRNGQLSGTSFIIEEGNDIRSVLVAIITQLTPFKSYVIQDVNKPIPHDIKLSTGVNVYQMITKVRDLYPAWETFIDLDETFVCQPIPTLADDQVLIDESILGDIVISENRNNDFTEIKNVVEVWGKNLTANWFTDSSIYSNNIYNISIENFELKSNTNVGFKVVSSNLAFPMLQINNTTAYAIVDENGNGIQAGVLESDTIYIVTFKNDRYYLLGQFQIYGIAKDTNEDSPFNIYDNGEILQVFSGGDFSKIYSDELSQQRAEYELWKSTRLNDSVTLEMCAIYWLDVNTKVRYKSLITGETNDYIVKKINTSMLNGTMTVEMIRFYPLYPYIITD